MRWSPILLAVLSGVVWADDRPEHPFPVNPQHIPQVRSWNVHYRTFEEWLNAARNGESEAQYYIGDAYLRGEIVPRDLVQAVKWLRKAADLGEHHAEYTLGLLYSEGLGVERSLPEARKWLRLAAGWNLAPAKQLLAELDRQGENEQLHALRVKAEQGDAAAQFKFAKAHLNGESGAPPDPAVARTWFERAAQRGHPESAFELAVLLRDGSGGARDLPRARKWMQRAAQVGVMRARLALAELDRVEPAPAPRAAAHPLLAAAQRGDARAQFELGKVLLGGDATRDAAQARRWLEAAARQDYLPAQLFLADALMRGVDFDQNYDEAAQWYLRAAQRGDAEAQYMLGTLYGVGLGVKADSAEAERWFKAAAQQGNVKARQRLVSQGS